MAYIGYIDREKYATKALELFNREKDAFISFACASLEEGVPSAETRGTSR